MGSKSVFPCDKNMDYVYYVFFKFLSLIVVNKFLTISFFIGMLHLAHKDWSGCKTSWIYGFTKLLDSDASRRLIVHSEKEPNWLFIQRKS